MWEVFSGETRANLALLADPERWRELVPWCVDTKRDVEVRMHHGSWSRVTANTIKFLADGVVESGTARMLEPYCGCGGRGIPN